MKLQFGRHGKHVFLTLLFIILAAAALVYLFWQGDNWQEISGEEPPLETAESEPQAIEDDGLPHDKLYISVARQHYQTGDLHLIIPKLQIKEPLQNGTTTADLRRGACLYEYAQLPNEKNSNVSIAAHRNGRVNGKVTVALFYYIDTLAKDDYIYITDSQNIYRYIYDQTTIVEPTDWSPIYNQGFSCVTLTSCEPIGISTHRIIVRARLDNIAPLDDNYDFAAQAKQESKEQQ